MEFFAIWVVEGSGELVAKALARGKPVGLDLAEEV
jgi:hypothetical protein